MLVIIATLAFLIGWLALIVWQLRLAYTKGKVWSRMGYVTRESNEITFDSCVATYWVFLGFGIVMLYVLLIVMLRGGISD